MTQRPMRRRRSLKWIGLLLTFMMLALWVLSVVRGFSYVHPLRQWMIVLAFGRIGFTDRPMGPPGWRTTYFYEEWEDWPGDDSWAAFADYLGFGLPAYHSELGGPEVPVWVLAAAAGLATGILWWRDRRREPGHCQKCDYDLTGNESGVCPECGTPIKPGPPNP